MEILLQIGLLVIGFVMLIKGADWFVEGAAGIAGKLGIPQLVIGLTIVAMGTSAPEAAVSISAALKGNASISVGNVVGSNLMNILLILGITSVVTSIAVQCSTIIIELPFLLLITGLMVLTGLDSTVSRLDSTFYLILLCIYIGYLMILAKKGSDSAEDTIVNKPGWKLALLIVLGMTCIVLGSNVTVDAATAIASAFGISERIIGLTVVAFGTSLPELVTSVTAARKGNADIAIVNIVGSNIFNILFILGLTALICPVPYATEFILDGLLSAVAALLLILFTFKSKKLNRVCGCILLMCYAAYFVYLLV